MVWLPVRGMYVGTKGQPHKLPENIAEIPPQTKWRRSKWSVHLMGSVLPGISFPMWTDTVHTRDQFSHNVRYSRREQVLFTIRDQFSQTRDILTMWTGTYKHISNIVQVLHAKLTIDVTLKVAQRQIRTYTLRVISIETTKGQQFAGGV